jgi:nitrogen regulatory protein P-II 1
MKEITAIIQPHALQRVMHALHALPHFPGVTLLDAHGQGRGRGAGGAFRPTEDNFTFHRKTVLLVTCEAAQADLIATTLVQAARTGNKGDGLVTIKDVAHVIRIRTGEIAREAL